MSEPTYLESLGHIAVLAEVPVATVQKILDGIGARPLFVVNAVPLFPAEVCGTVMARTHGWTDQAAYSRRFDRPEEIKT